MPQIINTNIASLTAQRNLNSSQSANGTALERLSSGLRINSAKDDAAGLAISTKFESQVKGLNQAIRNAGDGISLAQTAEGALGAMTENLQRIRELAVQSSNATNSDDDRVALQQEVSQLMSEITRTAEETNFNGRNLLDGSFEGTFQIGADAGQTVDVKISELTADKLGVSDTTGVSAIGTSSGIHNGDLTINGVAIDPSKASSDTASIVDAEASAVSKVAAINEKSDETGVTAVVNTNVAAGAEMAGGTAVSGTVSINDVDVEISTGGLNTASDREAVITAINAKSDQTGVTAVDGGDEGGVILEAADGRNITVEFKDFGGDTGDDATISAATGLSGGSGVDNSISGNDERVTSYGGFTLISQDGSDIELQGGQGTGTGDITRAGLSSGVYSGREAAVTSTIRQSGISSTDTNATYTTGDMDISAGTVVNATNNSFEISLDGGAYQTLTLDPTDTPTGGTQGQYDDVEELADLMNQAIAADTTGAFYDTATNTALVSVTGDNATGQLTFTSNSSGEDAEVIVRTGSGNMDIADGSTSTLGVDGETFKQVAYDFNFDGTNSLSITDTTASDIVLDLGGAGTGVQADATITLTATATYTSAQDFADALNTAIAASTSANGKVEANVSDDGSRVVFTAVNNTTDPTNNTTTIAIDTANSTLAVADIANTVEHLNNGSVVITDVDTFQAGYSFGAGTAAGTDSIGINVDGAGMQTLELNEAAALAAHAADTTAYVGMAAATNSADYWAAVIQYSADVQVAGSGIEATAVGDQIVISSRTTTGGTVVVGPEVTSTTGALNITGAPAVIAGSTSAGDLVVSARASTLETAAWNVADGTGAEAAGTFMSIDPDGTAATFEAVAQPLTVETGVNDTFEISVDGGSTYITATVAQGTYNTLDELAAAISFAGNEATVAANDADTALVFTNANATAADQDLEVVLRDGTFAATGNAQQGGLVQQAVTPDTLESGDLVINGTSIQASSALDDTASDTTALTSDASASGIAIAAAINDATAQTGVTAEVNATTVVGGSTTTEATGTQIGATGTLHINNVETGTITLTGDAGKDRAAAIDAINAVSGQTGVVAEDNGESITLVAEDGRNISVAIDTKEADNAAIGKDSSSFGDNIGLSPSSAGIGQADITGSGATYANTAGTTYSTVTLKSAGEIEISNGVNGADEVENLGLKLGSYGGGESGTYLKDVDISTFEGAQAAISAIDNALQTVSSQRAELGALQNRFESTTANLQITSENLAAANSRIRDADFAAETAELSRTQVLQQAGISILAQANQRPQQVLSLLG